jgi:hypothetical protein
MTAENELDFQNVFNLVALFMLRFTAQYNVKQALIEFQRFLFTSILVLVI